MPAVRVVREPIDAVVAAVNHAEEIHVEDPPPVLQRKAAHLAGTAHAGVVDEQIEPLPLLPESVPERLPLGRTRHIEPLRLRGAARLLHERDGLAAPRLVDVADGDVPAVAGQPHGKRPPQPAPRSGDQRMATKVFHGGLRLAAARVCRTW